MKQQIERAHAVFEGAVELRVLRVALVALEKNGDSRLTPAFQVQVVPGGRAGKIFVRTHLPAQRNQALVFPVDDGELRRAAQRRVDAECATQRVDEERIDLGQVL